MDKCLKKDQGPVAFYRSEYIRRFSDPELVSDNGNEGAIMNLKVVGNKLHGRDVTLWRRDQPPVSGRKTMLLRWMMQCEEYEDSLTNRIG